MIVKLKHSNDWNKVSNKKELKRDLDKLKDILNDKTVDYLDSLIELDYSVISPGVIDKESLLQLELYRKIAIYNIYRRAVNIFKNRSNIRISGNNDGIEGLNIYTLNNEIELFKYDYSDNIIGRVDLFKTIADDEVRKQNLDSVTKTLETLYETKNPYCDRPGVFGGPGSRWVYNHDKDIKKYEELFNKLDRTELTDDEKREIEITHKYHDIIMKDFDLKEEDLEEEKNITKLVIGETHKVLVKKIPGLLITDNYKYI